MAAQQIDVTMVHAVRHGEVHNPDKVLYGRAPGYRLSSRGEQMATAAGEYLAKLGDGRIADVTASSLERAQQTAGLIAAELGGVEVGVDDRLLESRNFFSGRRLRRSDFVKHFYKLYNPFRPSWDEAYVSIADRMVAAVDAARDRARGAAAVLVSHQLPIWVLRRRLSGRRLWHSPAHRQCALGSVTSFEFHGDNLIAIHYHVPAPELVAAALADDPTASKSR
ncbi:MAG: histidine phosphatase family protein [Terriglobales bacterium]